MRQSCNFTNISQWIAHSKHCFCHFECFLMRTFSKAKGFSLHKPCFPSVIPCIPFNRVYQRILPPLLLQIYGASTASYGKKVSSTYLRYACGTFLPISSYLHRLFAKGFSVPPWMAVVSSSSKFYLIKLAINGGTRRYCR